MGTLRHLHQALQLERQISWPLLPRSERQRRRQESAALPMRLCALSLRWPNRKKSSVRGGAGPPRSAARPVRLHDTGRRRHGAAGLQTRRLSSGGRLSASSESSSGLRKRRSCVSAKSRRRLDAHCRQQLRGHRLSCGRGRPRGSARARRAAATAARCTAAAFTRSLHRSAMAPASAVTTRRKSSQACVAQASKSTGRGSAACGAGHATRTPHHCAAGARTAITTACAVRD